MGNHDNARLREFLEELRIGDPSIGGQDFLARFTVTLCTDDSTFSIREDWADGVKDEIKWWVYAYAGISTNMRFAAYVPEDEAMNCVWTLSMSVATTKTEWKHVEDAILPDIQMEVEVVKKTPHGFPWMNLDLVVGEGLTERDAADAAIVLREFLSNEKSGPIAGLTRAAYRLLRELTEAGLHDVTSPNAQVTSALRIMSMLEEEGFAWPVLGPGPIPDLPEENSDDSSNGHTGGSHE
jgi:hypothetical protein